MSKTNRVLAVVAAILLALSVFAWRSGQERAERFERGQRFLPNLNPDEIASVSIASVSIASVSSADADEIVTLQRDGDRFTVAEKSGYPAANEAVNDFVREVLELSLEKEIGAGSELEEELGIEPPGEEGLEVALANATGQEMVRFRVGESFADGTYVQRRDEEGAPIYLTSARLSLSSGISDFLEKVVVEVDRNDVRRVEGPDFVLEADAGGDLVLSGGSGEAKGGKGKIGGLRGLLSPLRFEQVWVADDAEVSRLSFEETLRIDLADGSGYILAGATRDERHFLEIRGFHTVERVEIALDTPDEELERKAETLSRADEILEFNEFHGSWVYEVGEWTGEKLLLRRQDLLED